MTYSSHRIEATASYSCDNGYFIGNANMKERHCVDGGPTSGTWDGRDPTCEGKQTNGISLGQHLLPEGLYVPRTKTGRYRLQRGMG